MGGSEDGERGEMVMGGVRLESEERWCPLPCQN